jgi:hypothetical protein
LLSDENQEKRGEDALEWAFENMVNAEKGQREGIQI